jgi:hypothetical protein
MPLHITNRFFLSGSLPQRHIPPSPASSAISNGDAPGGLGFRWRCPSPAAHPTSPAPPNLLRPTPSCLVRPGAHRPTPTLVVQAQIDAGAPRRRPRPVRPSPATLVCPWPVTPRPPLAGAQSHWPRLVRLSGLWSSLDAGSTSPPPPVSLVLHRSCPPVTPHRSTTPVTESATQVLHSPLCPCCYVIDASVMFKIDI